MSRINLATVSSFRNTCCGDDVTLFKRLTTGKRDIFKLLQVCRGWYCAKVPLPPYSEDTFQSRMVPHCPNKRCKFIKHSSQELCSVLASPWFSFHVSSGWRVFFRTLELWDTGTLKQATTIAFYIHAVSWIITIVIYPAKRCVISIVDARWNNRPRRIVKKERERVLAVAFRRGMKVSTQNPDSTCWLKNNYSGNVVSFRRLIWLARGTSHCLAQGIFYPVSKCYGFPEPFHVDVVR